MSVGEGRGFLDTANGRRPSALQSAEVMLQSSWIDAIGLYSVEVPTTGNIANRSPERCLTLQVDNVNTGLAANAIGETPEPVEHAIMVIANGGIEAALADVIRAGVKSVTLMASGYLEGDSEPKLVRRLTDMANEAGPFICRRNWLG